MMQLKKHLKIIFFLIVVCSFNVDTEKKTGVTSCESPLATGVLKLQVKNDSIKYMCQGIKVINGKYNVCDSNKRISHSFFIQRQVIDSNWLIDPIKLYDQFPDVSEMTSHTNWFIFISKKSQKYKEDFTSSTQKSGVTYRHHESKKDFINYVIAKPSEKAYLNKKEFQFKYDWEENIKGKYESFYDDGTKRFRHKYIASKFMALDKKLNLLEKKSNSNVTLSGVIESYHKTGKKKEVIIYNDTYIVEQKPKKLRKTIKAKRSGERKIYTDSGKLFSSGTINLKGYQGELDYFSSKKIIIKTENYKDGILDGKFKEFSDDGTIKTKGQFTLGQKVGKWQYFDQSGKKTSSTKF
jgi:antitoxin component YwqK of YwqJK toxin-antitoxin module